MKCPEVAFDHFNLDVIVAMAANAVTESTVIEVMADEALVRDAVISASTTKIADDPVHVLGYGKGFIGKLKSGLKNGIEGTMEGKA